MPTTFSCRSLSRFRALSRFRVLKSATASPSRSQETEHAKHQNPEEPGNSRKKTEVDSGFLPRQAPSCHQGARMADRITRAKQDRRQTTCNNLLGRAVEAGISLPLRPYLR